MKTEFEHIYIHLPFCDVICHYCDFYTARTKEADHKKLFDAIGLNLAQYKGGLAPKLKAIYFGGGTPSVTPPNLLSGFITKLQDKISPDTEITLEANPNNVTADAARAWKAAGVNRISIGIQSLRDPLLKRLGRTHSAADALRALETCLNEIENVSGDLIYGVPGQKIETPAEDALALAKVGVKHFSAYHLTLEPAHFMYSKLPDGGVAFGQVEALWNAMAPLGFGHYEISNFAKPGFESRNNLNYWLGGAYLALGPSAHGFDGHAKRWQNVPNWQEYSERISQGTSPISMEEELTPEQRRIEALFTGLRIKQGIHLPTFRDRFGMALEEERANVLKELEKSDLGHVTNDYFVLTFRGRMLADEIARKLL